MFQMLLDHLFRHLAYRGAKIPSRQKCQPQYRFFTRGNSSNSFADVRPLIRLMISLGAIFGGQLVRICTWSLARIITSYKIWYKVSPSAATIILAGRVATPLK